MGPICPHRSRSHALLALTLIILCSINERQRSELHVRRRQCQFGLCVHVRVYVGVWVRHDVVVSSMHINDMNTCSPRPCPSGCHPNEASAARNLGRSRWGPHGALEISTESFHTHTHTTETYLSFPSFLMVPCRTHSRSSSSSGPGNCTSIKSGGVSTKFGLERSGPLLAPAAAAWRR